MWGVPCFYRLIKALLISICPYKRAGALVPLQKDFESVRFFVHLYDCKFVMCNFFIQNNYYRRSGRGGNV